MRRRALVAAILTAFLAGQCAISQLTHWSKRAAALPREMLTYDFEGRSTPERRSVIPYLKACRFINARYGWAGGSQGALLRSIDGGQTWQPSSLSSDFVIEDLWFVNQHSGWLVGYRFPSTSDVRLLRTDDGGEHWKWNPRIHTSGQTSFESICFLDARHGWIAGTLDGEGAIWHTKDGGTTWSRCCESADHVSALHQIRFANDRIGWAVGQDALLRTSDGGRTWLNQARDFQTSEDFTRIQVLNSLEVWASGTRLVHSRDGGHSWETVSIPGAGPGNAYTALFFLNQRTGWVSVETVGHSPQVMATHDGGLSWNLELHDGSAVLDFASTAESLFAVTGTGLILHRDLGR